MFVYTRKTEIQIGKANAPIPPPSKTNNPTNQTAFSPPHSPNDHGESRPTRKWALWLLALTASVLLGGMILALCYVKNPEASAEIWKTTLNFFSATLESFIQMLEASGP